MWAVYQQPKRLDKMLDGLITNFKVNIQPSANLFVNKPWLIFVVDWGPNSICQYCYKNMVLKRLVWLIVWMAIFWIYYSILGQICWKEVNLDIPTCLSLHKWLWLWLTLLTSIHTDRYYTSIVEWLSETIFTERTKAPNLDKDLLYCAKNKMDRLQKCCANLTA